jgi:hypothetical protein
MVPPVLNETRCSPFGGVGSFEGLAGFREQKKQRNSYWHLLSATAMPPILGVSEISDLWNGSDFHNG